MTVIPRVKPGNIPVVVLHWVEGKEYDLRAPLIVATSIGGTYYDVRSMSVDNWLHLCGEQS